jgi:hypothetical protein
MIGRTVVTGERGAVVPITAFFMVVLFGFMALAIDVARLYEERRQLSNNADFSAMAGAQFLWKSKTDAEAAGQAYVAQNPTTNHPGPYSTPGGDFLEAKRQADGTGCWATLNTSTGSVTMDPNHELGTSQQFDCIESTVTAPRFEFVFAKIFGYDERSISVKATTVMGNAAPKGRVILPWLLRDCPNPALYPDEASASVIECPYKFRDSFSNNPNDVGVTKFKEEFKNFSGAALPYQESSGGCPLPDGHKVGSEAGNSVYQAILSGSSGFTPCRVAPGMRLRTRGGALGTQTNPSLQARGISADTCANEASFNSDLGNTGDGDGFVTINKQNPCMVIVAFVTYAAPATRVPSVTTNVAGTPAGMQAMINEPGLPLASRFSQFENNQVVVVRRFSWYYITGFDPVDSKPVGVYLRAIENGESILWDNMDTCPASQSISECAQSGVYITKLVN